MKFINIIFYKAPLHIAIEKENIKVVKILLEYPETDVNIKVSNDIFKKNFFLIKLLFNFLVI